MIRTALIYVIADKCIDRIFDSINAVLISNPNELNTGMLLKWVQYREPYREDDENEWGLDYDVLLTHVIILNMDKDNISFIQTADTEYYTKPNGLKSWMGMALPCGAGIGKIWSCKKILISGWEA